MSAEFNKILCAILSAILVLLLSSFISELLYHPKKIENMSYEIQIDPEKEIVVIEDAQIKEKIISSEDIKKLMINASLENGEKFVSKNCSACHSFKLPVKNKIGPSLAKVFDRKVGSIEGYKYSKYLKQLDENWTNVNLYLFLQKPKTWAPGTKMAYRGISKENDLINVIKYLFHTSKLNEG